MEDKKTYAVGDEIQLTNQKATIEKCKHCDGMMVNLDVNQLAKGDLTTLKNAGVAISNPDTDKDLCIKCEHKTLGRRIADFFEGSGNETDLSDDSDDDSSDDTDEDDSDDTDEEKDDDAKDDDSSFFHPSSGGFLGGSEGGGFGGGMPGGGFSFGGGGFSGGGASRAF
jgi:uncharacterized membrane protein YgcG